MEDENTRVKALRDRLETSILKACSDSRINGDTEARLPNTTNISFEYIEGEAILLLLDRFGICASSGSACTSGSLEPSHVLRAMGVPFTAAHGSIRFSLSRYNTQEEVDFTIDKMPHIIEPPPRALALRPERGRSRPASLRRSQTQNSRSGWHEQTSWCVPPGSVLPHNLQKTRCCS